MRHAGNFNPEWGYLAPAPSFLRTARLIVVVAGIAATASGAVVFSMVRRPRLTNRSRHAHWRNLSTQRRWQALRRRGRSYKSKPRPPRHRQRSAQTCWARSGHQALPLLRMRARVLPPAKPMRLPALCVRRLPLR